MRLPRAVRMDKDDGRHLFLPNARAHSILAVAEALERAAHGMGFADSLHLGAAPGCETMLTFDRRLVQKAKDAPVRVMEP